MFEFNREKVTAQMEMTLKFADVPFAKAGIDANIEAWQRHKGNLINLLRKHPQWNEDALAIIMTERQNKAVDEHLAYECLYDLANGVYKKGCVDMYNNDYLFEYVVQPRISAEAAEVLNRDDWGTYQKASAGQKTTRYIRKLMLEMGVPADDTEVWSVYARYADALSEYTVDYPLIISANPSDYLMASYGTNWSSCHIINPRIVDAETSHYSGQSKGGCLSYLIDESSLIVYTVRELPKEIENLPITKRHTRQMFMINQSTRAILQSRLYPYIDDIETINVRRAIMQEVMAKCWDMDNYWDKRPSCDGFRSFGVQYPDYDYVTENHVSTSIPKNWAQPVDAAFSNIGDDPHCLVCGTVYGNASNTECSRCRKLIYCECCGDRIDLNDTASYITHSGYNFHVACVAWCTYHNRYEPKDNVNMVHGVGTMCLDGIRRGKYVHFKDEWYSESDLPSDIIRIGEHAFENEEDAYSAGFVKCDICGKWETRWSANYVGSRNRYVCDECYMDAYRICAVCGGSYNKLYNAKCPECGNSDATDVRR